ncbi:hypothetical protein AHR05_004738 [Salmonella enterica subsp. salamae]|nr:hypothetical protein [Salmonella enterica subsp. salamae]
MEFTKEQLIEKAKENVEFFRERLELLPQSQPMALSLRLAEITLASLEAEPVAWRYRTTDINGNPRPGWSFSEEASLMGLYQPLYTAPPVPVVPDEMYWQDAPAEGSTRAAAYATGWNACRAAMLKGNVQ